MATRKEFLRFGVNDQYRIEFAVSHELDGEEKLTICNIIELSNHYKS